MSFSEGGLFDSLPEELIRHVYSYADIPSLATMMLTGKNLSSQYASDDITWGSLVERRFRVSTEKVRPKIHGGRNWKEAYRSLSHCDRMPKNRYTSSQKIVFARGRAKQRKVDERVSMWVMMAHTENCRTRTVPRQERSVEGTLEGDSERFVELYLCLQNIKSGGESVITDVMESALVLLGSTGNNFDPMVRRAYQSNSFRPKMLLHDKMESSAEVASRTDRVFDISNGITLRPFEVAVLSVHFPCSQDLYETDFLARAVSLHVPVRISSELITKIDSADAETKESQTHASAFFLPENDVWNYYDELPGGFLTLADRNRLIAAW